MLITTLEGKLDQLIPRWIEAKISHYLIHRSFELGTFCNFVSRTC